MNDSVQYSSTVKRQIFRCSWQLMYAYVRVRVQLGPEYVFNWRRALWLIGVDEPFTRWIHLAIPNLKWPHQNKGESNCPLLFIDSTVPAVFVSSLYIESFQVSIRSPRAALAGSLIRAFVANMVPITLDSVFDVIYPLCRLAVTGFIIWYASGCTRYVNSRLTLWYCTASLNQ